MEIDLKTPLMILEFLLNQFDSNQGIPVAFQIGAALPDWERVSASSHLTMDELDLVPIKGVSFFSSALLGHGIMSNFFHFDFVSPRLKVAVSFPYGNILSDDESRQEHAQNTRSIIAALYLLFRVFREGRPSFLPENGQLLVVCQDFNTAFRLRDAEGIVREEQNWQGLLDLLTAADEPSELFSRIYV